MNKEEYKKDIIYKKEARALFIKEVTLLIGFIIVAACFLVFSKKQHATPSQKQNLEHHN